MLFHLKYTCYMPQVTFVSETAAIFQVFLTEYIIGLLRYLKLNYMLTMKANCAYFVCHFCCISFL